MRSRRGFIAGAAGAVAAVSGCLGYEVRSAGEVDERLERIDSLEDRLDEKNATAAELRNESRERLAEINDLEDQLEASNETASSLRADVRDAKIDHVVSFYSVGEDASAYGNGSWSEALDIEESDDYVLATMKFGQAYSSYGRAADVFGEAETVMGEYDMDVPDVLATAVGFSATMQDASSEMQLACYNYANGDFEEGNGNWNTGVEKSQSTDDNSVPDLSEFEDAVSDLDQGTAL